MVYAERGWFEGVIRPEKTSDVKRFLIELGAYPAEAEKIISSKSGKLAKMIKQKDI